MANIKPYVDQISNAVYGEEVRGAIINALEKVNDDNNSYQEIKNAVVQAKDEVHEEVTAFDAKMQTAREIDEHLSETVQSGNTADTDLKKSIEQGTTLKTGLDGDIEQVERLKAEIPTLIQDAGKAKESLDAAVDTADTKKKSLDSSVESASDTNATLSQTIKDAVSKNTILGETMDSATTKNTVLAQSITEAGKKKTALDSSVETANTTKNQIQAVIGSGNEVKSAITAENEAAGKYIDDLKVAEENADEILHGVTDLKAYLGYYPEDVLGVQVDYKNKSFTRLAGAIGLTAGANFDSFNMYGGRKRCNVSDDGTINAFYGDDGYTEDGSNGQVMVYQPKFWYKILPVFLEPQTDGIGYHLRKANYYVSQTAQPGFKLHPAFYDENGNEVDYILFSAFEGSVYDTSASAYLMNDEQIADFSNDLFCSIAGAKPASGLTQNLTRPNIEAMARKRGKGWHGNLIRPESANQLLMIVEMGTMDLQTAIGQGVVSISDNSVYNCSSLTGSTASIGNATGQAAETINDKNGVMTTETTNGKTSITYRGMENPWGNIWKFVYDVNIWGNGSMKGGVPYVCKDLVFAESKNNGNYESAGFTLSNASGYISAMGYGDEKYDWLFFASECTGNSSLPVGDYTYVSANLNGYRVAQLGGFWYLGASAGPFGWFVAHGVGYRYRYVGGRLVYVPTANAA